MRAAVYREFGPPDVLRIEDVEKPVPKDGEVLVRVRAASVNPLDWHYMEGTPYVVRLFGYGLVQPSESRIGVDFAGTVEAVGSGVTRFKSGDDVFGFADGACAEYVCLAETRKLVLKPKEVSFEHAASAPIAAITALQSLRDAGAVGPGTKVLINGASGGVGTFAVQIAKALGAEVTGVCSTRNLELVRSLGADHVVDYTKEDFTESAARYDVIVDNVGNRSLLECRRALAPRGKYVLVGGGGVNDGRWAGPLINPIRALLLSQIVDQQLGMFMAKPSSEDLTKLGEMMAAGTLKPVIDKRYPLSETAEAIGYLEAGRARGKVLVTFDGDSKTSASEPVSADHRTKSRLIAFALVGGLATAALGPIVLAFALNRRFRRRHPSKRSFRWGFYFASASVLGGLGLGVLASSSWLGVLAIGAIYAILAYSFARRARWAWVALTLLSFNPILWIANALYLRRRWTEDRVPSPGA